MESDSLFDFYDTVDITVPQFKELEVMKTAEEKIFQEFRDLRTNSKELFNYLEEGGVFDDVKDHCSPACLVGIFLMYSMKRNFYCDLLAYSKKFRESGKDKEEKSIKSLSEEAKDLGENRLIHEIMKDNGLLVKVESRLQEVFGLRWISKDELWKIYSKKSEVLSVYTRFTKSYISKIPTLNDIADEMEEEKEETVPISDLEAMNDAFDDLLKAFEKL